MSPAIPLPDVLRNLDLHPLFAMELAVDTIHRFGPEPMQQVSLVSGGRFAGERLGGQVLAGGRDWQTIPPDRTVLLDCRIVLQTEDGAKIAMSYKGRAPPRRASSHARPPTSRPSIISASIHSSRRASPATPGSTGSWPSAPASVCQAGRSTTSLRWGNTK